jgi:tyrosine-protein kinase Etk/Wzc
LKETTEGTVSFLDYILALVQWRKRIVGSVIGVMLLALIITFLMPYEYRARATILPPQKQSSLSGLSGMFMQSGGMSVPGLSLPGLSNDAEVYAEILHSRTILNKLVDQFSLMDVYQMEDRQDAIDELKRYTTVKLEKAMVIAIQVDASTPQLAADLANSYVEELDHFNRFSTLTSAKNTRIFIERRLNDAKQDLFSTMEELQGFQEKNRLISLPEQAKLAVEAAANLEAQVRLFEIELAVIRSTVSSSHPEVAETQLKIRELRKQLTLLRQGSGDSSETSQQSEGSFNIPFTEVPALQLRLGQLMLDMKIHQAVVEILTQQYEHAKIEEVRDTPTVRILDKATPPTKRSKPERLLIVVVSGILSLFFSVLISITIAYTRQISSDDETAGKINEIFRPFHFGRK